MRNEALKEPMLFNLLSRFSTIPAEGSCTSPHLYQSVSDSVGQMGPQELGYESFPKEAGL